MIIIFKEDVDDVTQLDIMEHVFILLIALLMTTLYDTSVGLVLMGMTMINLFFSGFAYAIKSNTIFGFIVVPGSGDELEDIGLMSVMGLVAGVGLAFVLGMAIGSTEFLLPVLGTSTVPIVGGPFMTGFFMFLMVVVAYPRAEESLWQVFTFTFKEKLEDNIGLLILAIISTSFAFGYFHIATATKLLEGFGVPLSQNLINVSILRLACSVGALTFGMSFAKNLHSGFNLPSFIALAGKIFK